MRPIVMLQKSQKIKTVYGLKSPVYKGFEPLQIFFPVVEYEIMRSAIH